MNLPQAAAWLLPPQRGLYPVGLRRCRTATDRRSIYPTPESVQNESGLYVPESGTDVCDAGEMDGSG